MCSEMFTIPYVIFHLNKSVVHKFFLIIFRSSLFSFWTFWLVLPPFATGSIIVYLTTVSNSRLRSVDDRTMKEYWEVGGKTLGRRGRSGRRNFIYCHCVRYNAHMNWPGLEPKQPSWEPTTNLLGSGSASAVPDFDLLYIIWWIIFIN
jgi:hypothetical protein